MKPYALPIKFLAILTLIAGLNLSACGKKEAPKPQPETKPEPPKLSLSVSQLMGLRLNGKPVEEVARATQDSSKLDTDSLAKTFDIQNEAYLDHVLKIIETQLQSGNPLKFVSILFGKAPKELARQCLESAADGQCLIEPMAFNCHDGLSLKNWTPKNYAQLCVRLSHLKALDSRRLVALFSGESTLWPAPPTGWPDATQLVGKTLRQAAGINDPAMKPKIEPARKDKKIKLASPKKETTPPKPLPKVQAFPEMVDLLKLLQRERLIVGVVDSLPLTSLVPTVESLGVKINLDRIIGREVFLQAPGEDQAKPLALSRLIQQGRLHEITGKAEPFKNYSDFLSSYGNWIITGIEADAAATQGKGVQVRSMVRRQVAFHNQKVLDSSEQLEVEDFYLAFVGGHEFGRVTDVPAPQGDRIMNAREEGSDQNLSQGLPYLSNGNGVGGGLTVLWLQHYTPKEGQGLKLKLQAEENFSAYLKQIQLLHPRRFGAAIRQPVLAKAAVEGAVPGFLPERPKLKVTLPSIETKKEEESKPEKITEEPPKLAPLPPATPESN